MTATGASSVGKLDDWKWTTSYRHSRGGDLYEENNLQALCRSCHIAKTASENRRVWAGTRRMA